MINITIDFSKAFGTFNQSLLLYIKYFIEVSATRQFQGLKFTWRIVLLVCDMVVLSSIVRLCCSSMKYLPAIVYIPVQREVLTGRVLGPQLFNIYINSLLELLLPDSSIVYADDVILIAQDASSAKAIKNMQLLLHVIDAWANSNLMRIYNANLPFYSHADCWCSSYLARQ